MTDQNQPPSAPSSAGPGMAPPEPAIPPQEPAVPTGDQQAAPVGSGAFVPSGGAPQQSYDYQVPGDMSIGNQPKGSGSFLKTIFRIFFILLLFGGLGVAGWYGYQYYNSSKPVALTYWGLWEDETIIQPVIQEFNRQHPEISVTYIKQSPKQYRERLQAAIDRGEGPDVFRFHNTWVPMLRNQLATIPPDIMGTEEFAATFYPVAGNDLVAGTNIYGIPLMIDGLGLFVNEDMLAQNGIAPPATWDDLVDIVPRLTAPSVEEREGEEITTSAIALGTATNIEHFSDILALMMVQNGVRLSDPTSAEAEGAMLFYRKFSDPSDPLYTWNESMDNSINAFVQGRVAMIFAPSWRVFTIEELKAQMNPGLRYRIVPVPQLAGTNVTWASYWVEGVSSASQQQPQAFLFLDYLTSKEAAVRLFTEASKTRLFGEPYARKDLASQIEGDPYMGAFITQAPAARSFPLASRTHDNGLNDKLIKYLEDAVNSIVRGASPTQALGTYAQGLRQVFSQYGLSAGTAPAQPR